MLAIVLYGVGVPLINLGLVLRDRHAIMGDQPLVGLSAHITFLHADYSKTVYWWELVESMKKLVLTGLLALMHDPGTLQRLFVAIIVSFVTLMLQVSHTHALASPSLCRREDPSLSLAPP